MTVQSGSNNLSSRFSTLWDHDWLDPTVRWPCVANLFNELGRAVTVQADKNLVGLRDGNPFELVTGDRASAIFYGNRSIGHPRAWENLQDAAQYYARIILYNRVASRFVYRQNHWPIWEATQQRLDPLMQHFDRIFAAIYECQPAEIMSSLAARGAARMLEQGHPAVRPKTIGATESAFKENLPIQKAG